MLQREFENLICRKKKKKEGGVAFLDEQAINGNTATAHVEIRMGKVRSAGNAASCKWPEENSAFLEGFLVQFTQNSSHLMHSTLRLR